MEFWSWKNMAPRLIFIALMLAVRVAFGAGIVGYPCFRTVPETYNSITNLAAAFPHLIAISTIGQSTLGNDILEVRITNNTNGVSKYTLGITSSLHANEMGPTELTLRWVEQLCTNYATVGDARWTLDYGQIRWIPFPNPDARLLVDGGLTGTTARTRKNQNDDLCGAEFGVDLNRNFPFKWAFINPETDPCAFTYQGTAAASEVETRVLTNWFQNIYTDQRGPLDSDAYTTNVTSIHLDIHTQAARNFHSWSWTNADSPNNASLRRLGRKLGNYNGYATAKTFSAFPVGGILQDYVYGIYGVPSITLELGLLGQIDCSNFAAHVMPANTNALLFALRAARKPAIYTEAPEVTELTASVTGNFLNISGVANDTLNGDESNHNITGVRYSFAPTWEGGSPSPLTYTPRANPAIADISGAIDVSALPDGEHLVFIEAQDSGGLWGIPSAAIFTTPGAPSEAINTRVITIIIGPQ